MTRPRKRQGTRSRAWAISATGPAQPARHSARCGAFPSCGGRGGCPCRAGRGSRGVSPVACRCPSQRRRPASCTCPLRGAVRWPGRSWTLWRSNCQRGGCGSWARAAMRPRTRCASYPLRWMSSPVCSLLVSALRRRPPGHPYVGGGRPRKGRCSGRRKPWRVNAPVMS